MHFGRLRFVEGVATSKMKKSEIRVSEISDEFPMNGAYKNGACKIFKKQGWTKPCRMKFYLRSAKTNFAQKFN